MLMEMEVNGHLSFFRGEKATVNALKIKVYDYL
jgi:hypothetical protein